MRSGTHLLIDLMLNNFPQLRGESLYVELDHAAMEGLDKESFAGLGRCICKTHYDGEEKEVARREIVELVCNHGLLIEPVRNYEEIKRSLQNFISEEDYQEQLASTERYHNYWAGKECLTVSFKDLISREGNDKVISQIASYIGEKPSEKRFYNRSRSQEKLILVEKLLTRLRGVRQRRVNTTIGFGLK